MRTFQKVLFMIAFLVLMIFTIRNVFVRYLMPMESVLDKYDRPIRNEIRQAKSLDELATRYETVKREIDAQEKGKSSEEIKKIREQNKNLYDDQSRIRSAIVDWEFKSLKIYEMRFYWGIGVICLIVGLLCYFKWSRWLGLSLIVLGFCEMIYWSSPTFFGGSWEAARLITQKIILSTVCLGLLFLVAILLGVFRNGDRSAASS